MSRKVEYGDFQTPPSLAARVCGLISGLGLRAATVVEPTCGEGAFLAAAADSFPQAQLYGCERNPRYADVARTRVPSNGRLRIDTADFFSHDWNATLAVFADPILILGNPPWVTNAAIGALGGGNLPAKSNADKLRGDSCHHRQCELRHFRVDDPAEHPLAQWPPWCHSHAVQDERRAQGASACLGRLDAARSRRHLPHRRGTRVRRGRGRLPAVPPHGRGAQSDLRSLWRFGVHRAIRHDRLSERLAARRRRCLRAPVGVAQRRAGRLALRAEARLQPGLRVSLHGRRLAQWLGRTGVRRRRRRVPAVEELGCRAWSRTTHARAGASTVR